jgi:Fe-S-cluster containining protein
MKILLDSEGKVNYDEIFGYTTVQELLDAVDIFLNDNPLHCDKCRESCCKKPWAVEVDNVCVNRLCNWDNEKAGKFVQDKLFMKENISKEFDQYVLRKDVNCNYISDKNLCTIYEQRPVICRLYICTAKSYRYNVIRELISAAYLKALVSEEEMRSNHFSEEELNMHKRNPAFLAKGYDALLDDMFRYAQEEGWIDADDLRELYRVC